MFINGASLQARAQLGLMSESDADCTDIVEKMPKQKKAGRKYLEWYRLPVPQICVVSRNYYRPLFPVTSSYESNLLVIFHPIGRRGLIAFGLFDPA
jgi:hypothetical protein